MLINIDLFNRKYNQNLELNKKLYFEMMSIFYDFLKYKNFRILFFFKIISYISGKPLSKLKYLCFSTLLWAREGSQFY